MLDTDFSLDGVSAKNVGIICGKPVSFTAAVPRITNVQIAGRSGDLQLDEGGFHNRTGEVPCYVLPKAAGRNITAMQEMSAVNGFLFGENRGYRRLITAEDADHYWLASVKEAGAIDTRLNLLNPFNIVFDCKPYRYLTGYDEKITVDGTETVSNPTAYYAYPLLYITGSADATIGFYEGYITLVSAVNGLVYDAELDRAYTGAGSSYDNAIQTSGAIRFAPGTSEIEATGATVQYIPRFREI